MNDDPRSASPGSVRENVCIKNNDSSIVFKSTSDTNSEIYRDALSIRKQVFVVEQHVPYQNELDQEDQCTHIVAYLPPAAASPSLPAAITEAQTPAPTASATAGPDLVPAGTIRILLKGPQKAKLQRLAVLPEFRKQQVATALMNYAENLLHDIGVRETYLDGQSYIKDFYLRLGYQTDGLEFEEEKIMHFLFTKQLAASN